MKRPLRFRRVLLALVPIGFAAAVVFAPAASAWNGQSGISCTGVTFDYTGLFTGPQSITQYVSIDGSITQTTFAYTDTNTMDTVPISVNDGKSHTIVGDAYNNTTGTSVSGFPISVTQTCGSSPPPTCNPALTANFRWHYSANGSSGSWSGTKGESCSFSMGPQDMEGDQKLAPGTIMHVGYDFTVPGNSSTLSFTVSNAQVVFTAACVSGATPSQPTFTVTMPPQTYTVTNSDWYPSGDQHSPLVYQGSAPVPDLCNGGQVRFQKGGTFSATLS